jgi:atlastin
MLRYLHHSEAEGERDKWLGDSEEALTGFSWRGGKERETTGIWMWSQPFFRTLPNGEEVAVLLMDTQGTFDNETSMKGNCTVFALSTLLSSVQVYNVMGAVQEDDLQHLHLFTEYSLQVYDSGGHAQGVAPFQSLAFLVRDWSHVDSHPWGKDGGADYLDGVLAQKPGQHAELKQVREHIHTCFAELECHLLPHPGYEATENPKFDGRTSMLRPAFLPVLKIAVESILAPEKLIVKRVRASAGRRRRARAADARARDDARSRGRHPTRAQVNGEEITATALLCYFKSYTALYAAGDLPQPKTVVNATAEANNAAAKAAAFRTYTRSMERQCSSKRMLSDEQFQLAHKAAVDAAMSAFDASRKMGSSDLSSQFKESLSSEIKESHTFFAHVRPPGARASRLRARETRSGSRGVASGTEPLPVLFHIIPFSRRHAFPRRRPRSPRSCARRAIASKTCSARSRRRSCSAARCSSG